MINSESPFYQMQLPLLKLIWEQVSFVIKQVMVVFMLAITKVLPVKLELLILVQVLVELSPIRPMEHQREVLPLMVELVVGQVVLMVQLEQRELELELVWQFWLWLTWLS